VIDVHSHVPTHRDAVPPDEYVENAKWRPDRVVAATTTWADYEDAFAEVEVSVAFTIARDRERVDPELNSRTAEFVAASPQRRIGFLSVHPEVEGAWDELERSRTDLGLKGIKLGPNYQIFDPLGPLVGDIPINLKYVDGLAVPVTGKLQMQPGIARSVK